MLAAGGSRIWQRQKDTLLKTVTLYGKVRLTAAKYCLLTYLATARMKKDSQMHQELLLNDLKRPNTAKTANAIKDR